MSKEDMTDVLYQVADSAKEHWLLDTKKVYIVKGILRLNISSEAQYLAANESFNFLYQNLKNTILSYTRLDSIEFVKFKLINNLILVSVKRK